MFPHVLPCRDIVFKINRLFSISRIANCFNVFSRSKAFHAVIKGSYLYICELLIFVMFGKCPMALRITGLVGTKS